MGNGQPNESKRDFKSLRDFITWELDSLAHSPSQPMGFDDDSESSTRLTRAARGKLRFLSRAAKVV